MPAKRQKGKKCLTPFPLPVQEKAQSISGTTFLPAWHKNNTDQSSMRIQTRAGEWNAHLVPTMLSQVTWEAAAGG